MYGDEKKTLREAESMLEKEMPRKPTPSWRGIYRYASLGAGRTSSKLKPLLFTIVQTLSLSIVDPVSDLRYVTLK